MRSPSPFLALPCPRPPARRALAAASSCLSALVLLSACPQEEPPPPATDTDTGEPSCLDTDTPGEDIIINSDSDIAELQLGECVPETIIISAAVTNLTPLANVREIGRLEVRFTASLTTMLGLQDLQRVDTLIITGNSGMTELLAWDDMVVNSLTITNNSNLTDIGTFGSVTSLSRLEIAGNSALTDYSGLEELTSVSGSVTLSDAALITDFTGLEKLTTIGGDFSVEDNPELLSFDGLGVNSVGGDLTIITNEKLSECLAEEFAASIVLGGAQILNGNKPDICG